jgi:hypothetical protein
VKDVRTQLDWESNPCRVYKINRSVMHEHMKKSRIFSLALAQSWGEVQVRVNSHLPWYKLWGKVIKNIDR